MIIYPSKSRSIYLFLYILLLVVELFVLPSGGVTTSF